MAKRGRPKNPTKAANRRITLIPSERAFKFIQAINKVRNKTDWIHQEFSNYLFEKYSTDVHKAVLFMKQNELAKRQDEIADQLLEIAKQLKRIQLEENKKKAEEELQKIRLL